MTAPFFDHPYLKGHHTPNRFEADMPDLFIEGDLPEDLNGVFFRNGAEALYEPVVQDYHWFDGDGMIYAFYFENGRVSMKNRWVRTDKFKLEQDAGRRLFGLFGNPITSDPLSHGTRYNTANTNIILHGGKLLALMEGAPPIEMDARTLETIGENHYGGVIDTSFCAHPKLDWHTGEMVSIGAMMQGPLGSKDVRYDVINRDGVITKTDYFEAPILGPMHTFFLTENWVIFPFIPIESSVERAKNGGPMTAWLNDCTTKFGVMPRNGSCEEMKWFEMPARHMFHELNVWEEGDKIIADVAAADSTALFPDENGNQKTHAETQQSLRRWTFDMSGKTNSVKEEILCERDIQFPRPDDRFMTRKTSQSYSNSNVLSKDGRIDGMDSMIRFDTKTMKEDLYSFPPGTACGELVFAPKLGAKGEADGYAMGLVHRANARQTELCIFAAKDIAAGPIAKVIIPFQVPSGFHCNYYSADCDLYTHAMP